MTAPGSDRAAAMIQRIERTALRNGVDRDAVVLLRDTLRTVLERRRSFLDEDHGDFLHPARTALILMDDLGVTDAATLIAAVLAETRDPALAPPSGLLRSAGAETVAILDAVPGYQVEDERLAEALVVAPAPARFVALAERLDHARHLHLRERPEWTAYHRTTCRTYAPVAERTEPRIGRRFAWWCRTFERRFLHP